MDISRIAQGCNSSVKNMGKNPEVRKVYNLLLKKKKRITWKNGKLLHTFPGNFSLSS
jgi:hypothetical protein